MPKTPSGVGCLEITNPFGLSHFVILPDRGSGSVLILIKLSDIAEILFAVSYTHLRAHET